jgi:hypothetical protein
LAVIVHQGQVTLEMERCIQSVGLWAAAGVDFNNARLTPARYGDVTN